MSSKLWVYGVRISDEGHVVIVGAQTEIAVGQEKVVRGNGKTYTLCFRPTCNVFKRIKLPTLLQSLPRMCCVVGGYEISLNIRRWYGSFCCYSEEWKRPPGKKRTVSCVSEWSYVLLCGGYVTPNKGKEQ